MSNGSDTTYTISIAGRVITLTPSTGAAQTITIPDDLDMGFGASGADGDKELKFVVQELVPSGKRDFSVTLASTGSSSERRYSFVKGAGVGSVTSSTDPDGTVRSVSYIARTATAFTQDERRKFRFQFMESARKNRSLTGAKLVVSGTEHDVEDWGVSSDRRYREVRTSETVTYRYRSGSAVTFNLKFGDGTYLGYTSEAKTTKTLLKEDMKEALGITDVRENVTSVLQDVTDAVATTSGEDAVTVSVPFDFHTVYDDAGMSARYDASAKWMSFEGLSDSERTSVVVRSNVRLRHNGGECSAELLLREFRGAVETNRWVLAKRDLEERGTLFAFDLAGESVEAEISGGRYYRFDVDAKRSGDSNATVGVHGTSAHVINFASFERVEEDRRWSPKENLLWPPNQKASVRLTYGDRESGLKTTGYFFADDEVEAEVAFSREWKGVIGSGDARVEFDVSYSGKAGSFRTPYDFKVAGSWVLSDGTVSDWEEKVEVSTTATSGSQSLTLTPPAAAEGMYLRYVRETNTFTGTSDEITFAAGDPVISYVSGATATVPDASETQKGKIEIADQAEVNALSDTAKAVTPGRLPDAGATQKGLVELADQAKADAGTDASSAMTPEMVKRRIDAFDSSGVAKIKDFGVPITRTKKTILGATDRNSFLIRPATGPITGNPKTALYVEEGSDESYLDTVSAGARVFYGSKVYTIATAEHGLSVGRRNWAKFTMSETLSEVSDDTSVTFYFTTGKESGAASVPDASDTAKGKIQLATQAEVNALSDTAKAVTPGRLPDAGATQKGLVELADQAEADSGTDMSKAMTPALVKRLVDSLGFAVSGSAPSSPAEGWIWSDTATDTVRRYDGSAWTNIFAGDFEEVNRLNDAQIAGSDVGKWKLLTVESAFTIHNKSYRRHPGWYLAMDAPGDAYTLEITIGQNPDVAAERGWSGNATVKEYGTLRNDRYYWYVDQVSVKPDGGTGALTLRFLSGASPSEATVYGTLQYGQTSVNVTLVKSQGTNTVPRTVFYTHTRSTAFPASASLAVGEKMTFKVFSDSARTRKIPFGPVYTWQALNRPLGPVSVFEENIGTNGVEWRYSKSLSLASNPAKLQLELHASSESDASLPAEWFTNNAKGYVSYVELSAAGRQVVHFSTAATSARFDQSQTVKASVLSNLYVGVRNDTTGDVISIGPVKKDGSDRYVWNAEAEKVGGFLSGAASGANDWTFVLFDVSKRDGDNPLGESITKSERDKLLEVERDAQRNVQSDWNAASGDAQILNKPTIPAAQVPADWNASSGVSRIRNKPRIPSSVPDATVRTKGKIEIANQSEADRGTDTTKAMTPALVKRLVDAGSASEVFWDYQDSSTTLRKTGRVYNASYGTRITLARTPSTRRNINSYSHIGIALLSGAFFMVRRTRIPIFSEPRIIGSGSILSYVLMGGLVLPGENVIIARNSTGTYLYLALRRSFPGPASGSAYSTTLKPDLILGVSP